MGPTPGARNLMTRADKRKAGCMSMGEFYRCAALCHDQLTLGKHGYGCPHRDKIWTLPALQAEKARNPDGPLKDAKLGTKPRRKAIL